MRWRNRKKSRLRRLVSEMRVRAFMVIRGFHRMWDFREDSKITKIQLKESL